MSGTASDLCEGLPAGQALVAAHHARELQRSAVARSAREPLHPASLVISLLDLGPNVLAYRAEGKLERADIERVFAELDRRLSAGEKIRVYAEVHSLSGISLEALWEDIRLGIQRWSAITKIEKAALVTDLEWLRKAAIWEDRVLRGLHMRTFSLSGQAEAQARVRS